MLMVQLLWGLAAMMTTLFGEARGVAAVRGVTSNENQPMQLLQKPDEDGLLRIKLIPHHVQRRRREREMRRLHGVEEGSEIDASVLPKTTMDRPHQYPRRRRTQENEGSPMQVAELFQGYGTHYADLWLGKPTPQRQTVIVDTGSGVTAFPCEGCENCGVPKYHADGLFDHTKSETFKKLECSECLRGQCASNECHISMSYQEGSSWSAFESQDTCYVGGLHSGAISTADGTNKDDLNPFIAPNFAFDLKFGCQTHLTGLFITQLADGIMGLDNAKASFAQQMSDNRVIPNRSFSLCYNRQDVVDPEGTESGAFTLGGSDNRLHKSPMVYSQVVGDGGFYGVKIRNMYLRAGSSGDSATSTLADAKVVPLGLSESTLQQGQVIVDSGTTDTYMSRSIGSKFASVFQQLSGQKYGHGTNSMTLEEVKALPTLLIQLVGDEAANKLVKDAAGGPVTGLAELVDSEHPYDVLLAVPPTHYMEYDPDDKVWVNRFYTDEPSGGVIGGNSMMGHDVFFDLDNGHLGWAEADCDYTGLLKKYTFSEPVTPSREQAPAPVPVTPTPPAPVTPNKPPVTAPTSSSSSSFEDSPATDDFWADKLPDPTPTQPFCSTLTCQGGLLAAVVLVVAFIGMKAVGRRSAAPVYEISDDAVNELELQDATGSVGSDGIRYRDQPENEEHFDDEPNVARL